MIPAASRGLLNRKENGCPEGPEWIRLSPQYHRMKQTPPLSDRAHDDQNDDAYSPCLAAHSGPI